MSDLICYKDKCKMQETDRNKRISANKTPGNMLSFKSYSDDTDILIDVRGFILIEQSINNHSEYQQCVQEGSFPGIQSEQNTLSYIAKGKNKAWGIAGRL